MTSDPGPGEATLADTSDDATIVARPEPDRDTLLGGRYRLGRLIARGGMGEVIEARDEQIGRDVAIKRIRSARPSPRQVARFLREASIQGRLEHPAFVPVHQIGHDAAGLPFFVMKKLSGTSLATILAGDAAVPLQRLLRAFADVCLAVELAHVRGIVHRDLKPSNITLGDFGEVYVLDWGVAKVVGEDDGAFADVDTDADGGELTRAGVAIGTGGYMAPEQVRGDADLDARADVYTLGCVLYEILARKPLHPRGAEGRASALRSIDARPSVRAPLRNIPPELDALCVAATTVDRAARIQTARELGARVQEFLDGDRDLALRRELAREHYQRARTAFEAGDADDGRRLAMREAAGALALDPKLDGAAELVGRLMLEPPRETPPEVAAAIAAEDRANTRAMARGALWSTGAGLLVCVPLLLWMSPPGSGYPVALGAVLVASFAAAIGGIVSPVPRPGLLVLVNVFLLVVLTRTFSPFMVAPGVAGLLAMGSLLTPRYSWLGSTAGVATLLSGAILVPWVLEIAAAISSTMTVRPDGLLFTTPAFAGREIPVQIAGVVFTLGLILAGALIGNLVRTRTRDQHRRLQLQAWRLRQLVPR